MSREFKETLEDEIGLDEIRNDIAQVAAPVPTKRQAPPRVQLQLRRLRRPGRRTSRRTR